MWAAGACAPGGGRLRGRGAGQPGEAWPLTQPRGERRSRSADHAARTPTGWTRGDARLTVAGGKPLSRRPTRSPVVEKDVRLPDLAVREAHGLHARVLRHVPLQVVVCPVLKDTRTRQRLTSPARGHRACSQPDRVPDLYAHNRVLSARQKAAGTVTLPLHVTTDSVETALKFTLSPAALGGGAEVNSHPGRALPPSADGSRPRQMNKCVPFKIFYEDTL